MSLAEPSKFPPGFLEETRAPQVVAGVAICQLLGTLVFIARVYSRLFIIKIWKNEDHVLALAWLFATAYSICQYGQVANGSGRHIAATTDPSKPITSQKYAYAAQLILFPALSLPKMSICLSYLRIFYADRLGHRLIQALMIILVLTIVPFFFEVVFQCKPIHVYWTEGRPSSKCLKDIPALFLNGSLNILVDMALMAIVSPRILNLKLNIRQKAALMAIVFLGFLAVAAGIVRMVRVGTTLLKDDTGNFDPSWDMYDISIWTSTEVYVSLICAAAPGVKPLISKILPHVLGTTLKSRTRTTGAQAHSIELRSKTKTSATGPLFKSVSMAGLTTAHGPYWEVGRGVDEESDDGKSEDGDRERSLDGGIMKKSEITVQSSKIR